MGYSGESFESFYQGEVSSLNPNYGSFNNENTNYLDQGGARMGAGGIGFPGSAMTANQLGETVNALKQGIKAFEVSLVVPETEQSIPHQHFAEMRALMKLSGVKPSVHGPLVDAAGFGEKGWGGRYAREDNERRMFDAIEKAHELDPNGNVPIVFHSTNGTPGAEYIPGEEGEDRFKEVALGVINRDTGQITQAKEHRTYYMSTSEEDFKRGEEDIEKGGTLMTAQGSVENQNAVEWDEKLKGIVADKGKVDRSLGSLWQKAEALKLANLNLDNEENIKQYEQIIRENPLVKNEMVKSQILLENSNLSFRALFDKAYKYGTDEQREKLKELADEWKSEESKSREEMREKGANPFRQQIDASTRQDNFFAKFSRITSEKAPELYQNVEKFAMDKAAETFGNLAAKSYDEYGGNAPIIAIENMFQGMAFSKADDLKELVDKSRKNFREYLVEEKGLSEKEAKKVAEKHLGVTWDVGHVNVIKKKGFTDEDIVSETAKIAPMVKHVHLTDNFGYSDSHLAPGMGNVPFKKILEELEKTGRLKEMRKIVESANFVKEFKKSPHPWTLSAFGSPIYGAKMGPYWNQAMDTMGSYFGGYGTTNPEQHHTMYGAGFTTMPVELGGQMPSATRSRFGGAPLA